MKLGLALPFVFALTALSAGCRPQARLDVPADFAEIDGNDYDYRAATAQGVVVAVRTEKNQPRASVAFWADAIDEKMERAGYSRDAVKDVASVSGARGRQLRYARAEEGRTYRYWLTVFSSDERVVIVEAGGDAEIFDPAQKDVERAVLSVRGI